MQKDEPVVMVLYHDTDSSSKHGKVNLHNLSIRCKAAGLAEDSADQYFAAGIDRTLNGGLTQCKLGKHFPQLSLCSHIHFKRLRPFIHKNEILLKGTEGEKME